MDARTEARLLEMLDRQAIHDCLLRYTRGIDRFDKELAMSAYHPDAIDHHRALAGLPEEFWNQAHTYHSGAQLAHHHSISNHSIEIDGDTAHGETYWMFEAVNVDGPVTLHGGRYIDRFEKREGQWKIAARACIIEWHGKLDEVQLDPAFAAAMAAPGVGRRDRLDRSYERPLMVTRKMGEIPRV